VTAPKYLRVTAQVRAQVAEGILRPGQAAPSGAALARVTGYSVLTCRKALAALIREGILVPGTSPGARARVPSGAPTPGERTQTEAGRALSNSLATRRRGAGLTQPQLAEIMGLSVTTIGHAETGRLWQSRHFWELVDKALSADGELLALHDAYRATSVPANPATVSAAGEN
jgi:DNA-binding transcriptional regulator YhcF (GntR family)